MTPTQMARRSDALYADGTRGMTRRVLCDMVAQREADLESLKAKNTKLREELAKARDPQRIGGQADPSSFAYAIEQLREFRWQHATNDEEAIPYINNVADAHERENAKLREQGERLFDKTLELGTESAKLHSICAEVAGILFNLDVDYCGLCDRDSINHPCPVHTVKGGECLIESELRELGVEVDT